MPSEQLLDCHNTVLIRLEFLEMGMFWGSIDTLTRVCLPVIVITISGSVGIECSACSQLYITLNGSANVNTSNDYNNNKLFPTVPSFFIRRLSPDRTTFNRAAQGQSQY